MVSNNNYYVVEKFPEGKGFLEAKWIFRRDKQRDRENPMFHLQNTLSSRRRKPWCLLQNNIIPVPIFMIS